MPSGILDACPVFTPATYDQCKRELKLWVSAQKGASIAQLIAEIIADLPAHSKVDGLEYMEETVSIARTMDMAAFLDIYEDRYRKTLCGRSMVLAFCIY